MCKTVLSTKTQTRNASATRNAQHNVALSVVQRASVLQNAQALQKQYNTQIVLQYVQTHKYCTLQQILRNTNLHAVTLAYASNNATQAHTQAVCATLKALCVQRKVYAVRLSNKVIAYTTIQQHATLL